MVKENLTLQRINDAECPPDKKQVFLWDKKVPGLGVRITSSTKVYIFQSRFNGKTLRYKIGSTSNILLDKSKGAKNGEEITARSEAKRLATMISQGIHPVEEKQRQVDIEEQARKEREELSARESLLNIKMSDAWTEYIAERRPHWGQRHYLDHIRLAQNGDEPAKRGKKLKKPGPLSPLMPTSLSSMTTETLMSWFNQEVTDRPGQARLAFGALKTFLNWCDEHQKYSKVISSDIITKKVLEIRPKKKAKSDCLEREQLPGWFKSVREISNPAISAYLQILLLTGARRNELTSLKWENIDFRWNKLTIHDKVEDFRTIPLTPYVKSLLQWLPKKDQYVFSSPSSASGHITEPRIAHNKACAEAGIEGLSLHGLRRSFSSLTEWCEVPMGVVAQIMGHKPSATAERHYKVRPIDLLRRWHVTLEEWILQQARIPISYEQEQEPTLKIQIVNK